MLRSRVPVLVALIVVLPALSSSQTVPMPPEFAPVRTYIEEGLRTGLAPSVALAIIREGRVIWAEGFGLADRERQRPAGPDTIYWLASVSKPITATGLMVLVERGQVDLDRPANDYLPAAKLRAFEGSADAMTIRRLANHTSGMPVHYNFYYSGMRPLSPDEVIARYGFAAWPPASRWEYSNLAFGILGYITEVMSKTPWRRFMERTVYGPLGMKRTWDGIRPGHEREAAIPYRRDAAGRFLPVALYDFDHRGASAIWSTANDLARFVRMHMAGGELDGTRVLSRASVEAMQTLTGESAPGTGTGIGWAIGRFLGRDSVSHTGGMPGVSTHVRLYPKDSAATIVLTNTDDRTMSNQVTTRLAQVLFGPPQPALTTPPAPAQPAASSELGAMAGTWEGRLVHFDGDVPLRVVVAADGAVRLGVGGREPAPVRDATVRERQLTARTQALLRTQDGFMGVPELSLSLTRDGERLAGIGVLTGPGWFSLSHRVELQRKPAS